MDGILIAFEGIDGAGKTTQVQLLGNALARAGESVQLSKEPTSGTWGMRIRESARTQRLPIDQEMEAFRRDREEHVKDLIRPALDAGKTVILDRYFYSYIAYQGARGADIRELRQSSESAPTPDVVFLLDIEPRQSLMRIAASRGDTPNSFETAPALEQCRKLFLEIAADNPSRIVVLDGTKSIDEIQRTIAETLLNGVLREKRCAKAYGCDDPRHCVMRMAGECQHYQLRSIMPAAANAPALGKSKLG